MNKSSRILRLAFMTKKMLKILEYKWRNRLPEKSTTSIKRRSKWSDTR